MKIVLTGGPHSGKTTLLRQLAEAGHPTLGETAFEIIELLNLHLGIDDSVAWRHLHRAAFQDAIAMRQSRKEADLDPALTHVVLDRGLLDGLAYCQVFGVPVPGALAGRAALARYDAVILCELILPFSHRGDTGRTSDEQTAREVEAALFVTYSGRGLLVFRLPQKPPTERFEMAQAIIAQVMKAKEPRD